MSMYQNKKFKSLLFEIQWKERMNQEFDNVS